MDCKSVLMHGKSEQRQHRHVHRSLKLLPLSLTLHEAAASAVGPAGKGQPSADQPTAA